MTPILDLWIFRHIFFYYDAALRGFARFYRDAISIEIDFVKLRRDAIIGLLS